MIDWNPDLYLKFGKERTLPARDLISRIGLENPTRILDIGCGSGNSTIELKKRWPNAEIIGIDNSDAMIEKARSLYPEIDFRLMDAKEDLTCLGKFDIVFSNFLFLESKSTNFSFFLCFFWSFSQNGVSFYVPFFIFFLQQWFQSTSYFIKWSQFLRTFPCFSSF